MSDQPSNQQKIHQYPIDKQVYCDNIIKKSEFAESYEEIISLFRFDMQDIKNKLASKAIVYDQKSPYEKFSFKVQKIVPCFDFYRLYVKISRFKFTVNLAKQSTHNLLVREQMNKGIYSGCYAMKFGDKSLFFKSFYIHPSIDFIKLLINVVREWSILKICSALECGPYLQNYLGFDIIIYDDCIQFALEKGEQISRLDSTQAFQLKEELSLMHSFNIIHCDIKPENIIFSPHYKKAVFIDFGFSEIIKEPLGYKTLSTFKGTPNFCTSEMLSIILDGKALIDLYYNDAFSLNETFRYCRQSYMDDYQDNNNQQIPSPQMRDKIEFWLSFLAFQYYYISRNQLKANQIMLQMIKKNTQNIKQILCFIRKGADYEFIPNFIKQNLKQFEQLIEYKQIKQKIKLGLKSICFQSQTNDQEKEKNEELDINELTFTSFQLMNFAQNYSYELYLKIIMGVNQLQSQIIGHLIALIFQCVRFDELNLDFTSKLKLAKHMNPLLEQYLKDNTKDSTYDLNPIDQSQQLRQIKILMRLIFCFYLSQATSSWPKQPIFDVFQQIIFLNDDCYQLSGLLLTFLSRNIDRFEYIMVALQLKRLLQSTLFMKVQKIRNYLQLKKQLCLYIFKYLESNKEQNKNTNNLEQKSILKILQTLQRGQRVEKQFSFDQQEQLLSNIINPRIRRQLFQYIIYNKIEALKVRVMPSLIIWLIEYVKRSIYLYNLPLFSRAKIFVNLIVLSRNFDALKPYQQYIVSIINCPKIFENFDFTKIQKNVKNCKFQEFSSMVDKLITDISLVKQPYYQILAVCWNYDLNYQYIKQNKQIYMCKLIELYEVYQKQKPLLKAEIERRKSFSNAYYQAKIQFFFFNLSPKTQNVFVESLNQYQQSLSLIQKESSVQQVLFVNLRVIFYRYYLSFQNKNYQMFFICFNKILQICRLINFNLLAFQIIKSANSISCLWKNHDLIIYSTQKYYQFCETNNDFSFYLLPNSKEEKYLLNALNTFARIDQPTFHQLLLRLTQFLSNNSNHSTKNYFINLINSIDQFIKKNLQLSYLIHCSRFHDLKSMNQLQINPNLLIFYAYSFFNEDQNSQLKLLKIFARKCDLLSNFARKILLGKYYNIILFLVDKKQSKRQILFVWRKCKNFIATKRKVKNQTQLFKIPKKTIFHELLKRVLKHYLKKI